MYTCYGCGDEFHEDEGYVKEGEVFWCEACDEEMERAYGEAAEAFGRKMREAERRTYVNMSECKHGTVQAWCAICKVHDPQTCTRWRGEWTCKDHGVQRTQHDPTDSFGEPRSERTKHRPDPSRRRTTVYGDEISEYLELVDSGVIQYERVAPFAQGHAPSGEWPQSRVPRTTVGPITKAIYNFKVPLYDWQGNMTYQVHAGVGHSWSAIEVSGQWWCRKESTAEVEDDAPRESEFSGSRQAWAQAGLGDGGERFARARAVVTS